MAVAGTKQQRQCCDAMRDSLRDGTRLGPAEREQAAQCAICEQLVANASLGRRLRAELSLAEEVLPRLPARPQRPSDWARLSEAPLGARRALALAVTLGVAIAVGLAGRRPDLAAYPTWRFAMELVVVALACGGAVWNLLQPPYRGVPSRWHALAAGGAFFLIPFVLIVGGSAHASSPELLARDSLDPVRGAAMCLALGSAFAAGLFALLALLDRGGLGAAVPVGQRAAASGLLAVVVLHLMCPNTDIVHIALSHSSFPVLAATLAMGWSVFRSRARPR